METTKILTVIAVVAVIASFVNILAVTTTFGNVKESGYANFDVGDLDLIIESAVNIRFLVSALDWGTGGVTALEYANLSSEGPNYVIGGTWTNTAPDLPSAAGDGLILENYGNVAVDLYLETLDDVDAFVCPTDATCSAGGPSFDWKLSDGPGETGSCSGGFTAPHNTWTPVCYNGNATCDAGGDGDLVCGNFLNAGTTNEIAIDIQIGIPVSAQPGARSTTLTATAVQNV